MTGELLTARVWTRIKALARSAGPRLIAVPFVAKGAAQRLRLRRGDVLVCRCDEATVLAGQTDPNEIITYLHRGVEVHSVGNLHAKVFVLGATAVVGSANVSAASETVLMEAAIESSSPKVVKACIRFVESLRGDRIGEEHAAHLASIYRPPKAAAKKDAKPFKKAAIDIEQGNMVAVALVPMDSDALDDAADELARKRGAERVRDLTQFTVDTFRWSGDVPATFRRGVRVLQIVRDGTAAHVFPPGRIVEIRRYRTRRGTRRAVVAVELPKRARKRVFSDVVKEIGAPAAILRKVKSTRELKDIHLIYQLGQLWPSATRVPKGRS